MTRVRFAPSPTGIPHIGNTRTALYNYLFTKKNQGKFILRIEDTDTKRLVPKSLSKILDILTAVGITWDEGPQVGGPHAPYIQSKRLKIYQQHAKKLVDKKKAYYCFCTLARLKKLRASQIEQKKLPCYDRHCLKLEPNQVKKKLSENTPYVIRLKVPSKGTTSWQDLIQGHISFENINIDDQVLLKSDGYPTYHLGVVVDDHLMKITHILRGVEWISSTPKHLLLYQAFNWPVPQIGHFPVILGPDKAKLSKRHGAKSFLDYLKEGYLVDPLITFMAYLGWSYKDNSELLDLKKLIQLFDLSHVQKSNPIFDIQKLDYFNSQYIRKLSVEKLIQLIKPFLKVKIKDDQLKNIIPLVQKRLVKLTDINDLVDYFAKDLKLDIKLVKAQSQKQTRDNKGIKQILELSQNAFEKVSLKDWQVKALDKIGHDLLEETNWSPRELFMTLRVVFTNSTATPPLFDVMQVLGKDLVLKRLKTAHEKV